MAMETKTCWLARGSMAAWYENVDGRGSFSGEMDLSSGDRPGDGQIAVVSAADVDDDGDLDALFSYHGETALRENLGTGTFGDETEIPDLILGMQGMWPLDVDEDGDLDLLGTYSQQFPGAWIFWHENTDGRGAFGRRNDIARHASVTQVVDLDSDGDPDVVGSDGRWFENVGGPEFFVEGTSITPAGRVDRPKWNAYELNGDNELDIVSVVDGRIQWQATLDRTWTLGQAVFVSPAAGASQSQQIGFVEAIDLDDDGDNDLVVSHVLQDRFGRQQFLAWYENQDGQGRFGEQRDYHRGRL